MIGGRELAKRKVPETVHAGPTKQFFVRMLTRDIELEDAILDLLDNCVDGILRRIHFEGKAKSKKAKPYQGYRATIEATPDHFEIVDNCGGIDRQIAKDSAFMLGRPDERDLHIETVGMYGIGMKRAIFKMGRSASVVSDPVGETPYRVDITRKWMEEDNAWELELIDIDEGLPYGNGTKIRIEDLNEHIGHQFDDTRSNFLKEGQLPTRISQLFALIIEKGFSIELNGKPISPLDMRILSPKQALDESSEDAPQEIRPYVFRGVIDGVRVDLVVGFYRQLATEIEIEDDLNAEAGVRPRKKDEAGWTVICNDRVVLHGDKSALTGWGTESVPSFHNQFISISGVVSFRSNEAMKLPLTTTKRGLDVSSNVFLLVRDKMREGLRIFTGFTYRWKGKIEDSRTHFKNLVPMKPAEIIERIPDESMTVVRKLSGRGEAKSFAPTLPAPPDEGKTVRISFVKSKKDVARIARKALDNPDAQPGEIGEYCFDRVLEDLNG
jgi:hypothetical protein